MTTLPTIVLVAGAFGTPASFDRLLPFFKAEGFATVAAPYPSSNPPEPSNASCEADIVHVRDNVIQPLVEKEHRQLVILAHSYGGIVAAGAAKGFDYATRRSQGLAGGVSGLVYIAGNIAHDKESLLQAVGGNYPPFIKKDTVCHFKRTAALGISVKSLSRRTQLTSSAACARTGRYRPCLRDTVRRLRPERKIHLRSRYDTTRVSCIRDGGHTAMLVRCRIQRPFGIHPHPRRRVQPLLFARPMDGKEWCEVAGGGLQHFARSVHEQAKGAGGEGDRSVKTDSSDVRWSQSKCTTMAMALDCNDKLSILSYYFK